MSIEGLLIGRVLGGRYRIEEVIGRGGMGAVYRALDERLGRLVALKVVTVSGPGDAESRQRLRARFFREARSAAALPHHPNVVPVYDYGSDEDLGLDYIVMELLRGSDLASRLARMGPPPLAASLKILLEAARGIAVGHRQGLIHRDVKPGNIFLTEPHPGEVQVRVVDFGIAKLADDEDTFGQLTQDGRVPHSPAYASPEQLRGLSHLTPASDVYSLGAVGYQMLTGERPFTDSDRNRMQLGMAVEPKALREHNPAIPGSIEALIRKAMAIDAQRRFRDADEMAAELERAMRLMADQPVEPYLAGAAIVTGTDETAPPETGQPLSPVASTAAASLDDDDRTRLFDDDEDRTLIAPPPPPPPVRQPAAARSATGRSGPRTPPKRPEPVAPPPVEPRRKRRWGGIFVWTFVLLTLLVAGMWALNEMSGSNRGPSLADQLRNPVVPNDEPIVVDSAPAVIDEPTDEELAREYDQRGRSFHAAGMFDSAYVYLSQAVELDDNVFEYRRNFGLALLEMGNAEEAADQFRRAIQLNPVAAPTYFNLAESQLALGDTTGGIDSLERYIAREPSRVSRATAESRLAAVRAAQNPDAPPLLGEAVEPGPGGQLPGPSGPSGPAPGGPGGTPAPSGQGGPSTPVPPPGSQQPSQVPSGNTPRN